MRILHVLRAPVGGLMRHVTDLIGVQAALGHEMGLACGGSKDEVAQAAKPIAASCRLGVAHLPMSRLPGVADVLVYRRFRSLVERIAPDVVHGHGAKGGALARLAASSVGARAFYTPHGGSLHYDHATPTSLVYLGAERWMRRRTAGLLFVCDWEKRCFDSKVGLRDVPHRVVHNGLRDDDFADPSCAGDIDILFVGELRPLKNVHVLLQAIAMLRPEPPVLATIVGDGPSRAQLEKLAADLGIDDRVAFVGRRPAPEMLRRARLLVIPSEKEALPYVALEGMAAGVPIIASHVGGLPEVLPQDCLVEPGNPISLAKAISEALLNISDRKRDAILRVTEVRARFNAQRMGEAVTSFYAEVLAERHEDGLNLKLHRAVNTASRLLET